MKNNTRKFLCLLLSIMMVFSLLSVSAFAAEEDLSVAGEDFFVEEEAELAVPSPEEEGAEVVLPEEPAEEDLAQPEEAELTISDVEEEGAAENANAAGSGTCGDNVAWELSDDGVLTITGTGAMADYYNAMLVPWYNNRESITSIVIENDVTSIGRLAFRTTALTSITIPDSVTSIGESAFQDCSSLKSIIFEGSAPAMWNSTFKNVTATAYYPAGDTTWTEEVRQDYGGTLTWVVGGKCGDAVCWRLDGDVLTIFGTGAMENYSTSDDIPWYGYKSRITSAVIESGVTSIGDRAFYYCNSMTSVTIPEGVTSIGTQAFMYCISLADTVIPDSVTSIGDYAFDNNNALINLIIPENVTSIGDYAFFYCLGLTSVTVGSGVTSIGAGAFGQCASLTSITFEGSAPTFGGSNVFFNTTVTAYYPAGDATWTEAVRQNYGGTITWVGDLSGCSIDSIPAQTYTGEAIEPEITLTLANGTTLVKDTDYTVSYDNNTNAGTAAVTLTGKGNYIGTATQTFTIEPKKVTPAVTLSATAYTWNGKAKKPAVTVKDGSTKLTTDSYSVKYAAGRKNVGKYKVTVTLNGNYSGSKTVYFKINPKGTSVKSLTAASRAVTVKWTKQATKMSTARITGYQIQLATDKNFKKNKKTVTVSGYSKVSKKVTGLKGDKKYYVRIRTYKTISGTKYYSSWSKAKTVTTKK